MSIDPEKVKEAGKQLDKAAVPVNDRWVRFACGCTTTNNPMEKDLEERCDGVDCRREAFDAWLLSKRLQDSWVRKHGVYP